MPNLTALENVELAAQICDDCLDASEILDKVGLGERKNNFPSQLSGGEQQRVSIARAIAKNPKLLLCDEPTGALDYNTGKQILQLLQATCRKEKITVLVITHNLAIAPMADKVIHFKNGTVTDITRNPQPLSLIHISCSRLLNSFVLKNSPSVLPKPSHNFLIVTIPGFWLLLFRML